MAIPSASLRSVVTKVKTAAVLIFFVHSEYLHTGCHFAFLEHLSFEHHELSVVFYKFKSFKLGFKCVKVCNPTEERFRDTHQATNS